MTREEAIDILAESKRQNEVMRDNPSTFLVSHQMADGVKNAERRIAALNLALSALRPVSREQVERVRGEWINTNKEVEQMCKCSKCGYPISYFWSRTPFCPNCGAPMTDEAVDMVLKRYRRQARVFSSNRLQYQSGRLAKTTGRSRTRSAGALTPALSL